MFSWYDVQTKRIMASGRNSDTINKAVNGMIDYLSIDFTEEELNKIADYPLKEKADLIMTFEFDLLNHSKEITDDWDFVDHEIVTWDNIDNYIN